MKATTKRYYKSEVPGYLILRFYATREIREN